MERWWIQARLWRRHIARTRAPSCTASLSRTVTGLGFRPEEEGCEDGAGPGRSLRACRDMVERMDLKDCDGFKHEEPVTMERP